MKVTCICPTNRNYNIDRLVKIFLAQDYPDKELTFAIDDIGGGLDLSYLPEGTEIGTYWDKSAKTIGEKRNRLVNGANGEIIVHMDDDDYYAPDYITQAVTHLINSKADVTGLSRAYFFQREPEQAWLYQYTSKMPYVIGSGMCYYKSVWERNRFKDINSGEDRLFLANAGRVVPHDYITGFVAFIHGNNTESHKGIRFMKPVSPDYVKNSINFTM